MPRKDMSQIKDKEKYETLRDKGMSKEKAARIANAGRSASQRGGKAAPYEDWNKQELYEKAKEVGIEGRSNMSKNQLMNALRNH